MAGIVTDAVSLRRDNSAQQHFSQTRKRRRIAVDEVELLEVLKARVHLIAQACLHFIAVLRSSSHGYTPFLLVVVLG